MKKVILTISLLFCIFCIYAQSEKLYLFDIDSSSTSIVKSEKPKRFNYNLNAGLGVGGNKDFLSAYGYVAPEIGYQLSEKFNISGGFAVSYSTIPQQFDINNKYGNARYTLFAKGTYKLLPKVDIFGAGMLSFSNYYNSKQPSYSGLIGARYHINEKSSISISVHIRKNEPLLPYMGLYNTQMQPFSPQSSPFYEW